MPVETERSSVWPEEGCRGTAMATAATALTWVRRGWGWREGGAGPVSTQCRRGEREGGGREEVEEEEEEGEEGEEGVVIPVRPDPNYLVPSLRRGGGGEEGDTHSVT